MKRIHKYLALGCAFALLTAALIYAHAAGPDPRHTGAPGDDPMACATSGCHTGTPINGGGGSVTIDFPDGLMTYTPGQQQMLTVTVTDPKGKFYGFQMTARLASNPTTGQAGDFTAGSLELVLCDDGSSKGSLGCRANASVQFIEHSTPSTTGKWTVKWTPPASDVGDVLIYVAANSNTQMQVPEGAHIYTANYTLSPSSGGSKPSISSAGVVSASAFNPKAGVASGTWLEIFGSNLATVTRGWGGSDFNGSNAPTALNGVSVSIDGKPAYVDYVSPSQVNVQVPDDPATGPVQLVVTNAAGPSNPITVQKTAIAPAVLAPSSFNVGGKQYVVAQFADGTFVGPANLISGVKFRPAKVGDIVIVYGIGFGPVSPGNASGLITSQSNSLQTKPNFRFGQTAATLMYDGLASGFVGLYQFNIQVPNVSSGDQPLNVDVGGVSTNQSLFITVQ
jgi:uncharacterized protein (TIGR03437 family)